MGRIIFSTILILFLLSLDAYIWSAFKQTFNNRPFLKYIFGGITLITIALIYFPAINTNMTLYPGYMVVIFGFVFAIIVAKLSMAFPLLVDDIIRFFKYIYKVMFESKSLSIGGSPISRLEFLKNTALGLGAITFSVFTYGIIVGRFDFKKHFVSLKLKNYPKGAKPLKVVQISDLHLGSFQRKDKLREAVQLINNEEVDLIFFTGDLVNNYAAEAKPFVEILKELKAKHGKYAVLGNHDYADYIGLDTSTSEGREKWQANLNEIKGHFNAADFNLLLNENRLVEINGVEINLVGVENWGDGRFSKYGDLEKAMQNTKDGIPTLLLSHDPTHWENRVLPFSKQIDLQLAGHTHGMQFGIEFAGIKWSPSKWKYKFWAGLYQNENKFLYVNRGIGHLGYPGRVGILPEITVLDIQST
ncbi:metallophosphoesterase [Flavobacteriales bacterium]|nr:metallophosphoesterase [Flavobacteriales bacterium]